jgi:hypothetical protein
VHRRDRGAFDAHHCVEPLALLAEPVARILIAYVAPARERNFAVDDEEPSDASLEAGFLSGDGNVATSPLRFSGFTASGDLPTAGCLAGGDWTTGWTTAEMN